MLLFLPQRSANTTQRSSNIYDFKCTATERKHCFRFLLRRSFYLLPAPSLILHLVILISNMFAVCSICVCLCILPCRLFCFVLFLVVLCSQFAYLSADLLIISKYTQHTRLCILCNVQCIPANKIKSRNYSRRSPAIRKPKRCSLSERSNKGKNCSPYLSALIQTPHLNAVCLLAASLASWIFAFAFYIFCSLIQTINWALLSATHS